MNRRRFCRALSATTALGLAGGRTAFSEQSQRKPNVLFFFVDDMNAWVNYIGKHPGTHTPNIDRLATHGMAFTRAYCPVPLCSPSRTAVLTGLNATTTGVYENKFQSLRLAMPNVETLPQHFMKNGYFTTGVGKFFHVADPPSWNEYGKVALKDAAKPALDIKIGRGQIGEYGIIEDEKDKCDYRMAEWAITALGKRYDKPFFMGVGFHNTHEEWICPRKYLDLYPLDKITMPVVKEDDLDDVPAPGVKLAKADGVYAKAVQQGKWRNVVQAYLGLISFVDAQVGRVLDALDASPYRDNTVIVFTCDHGFHLGEKLHWDKFTLWEEATHIPLIIAGPGIAPGRYDHVVSTLNLYPTLIDVCGLTPKDGLQGASMAPLLKNPQSAWNLPALSVVLPGNYAVRSDKWRYIGYVDGSEELYDEENDPNEWKNLAADPKLAGVKKELAVWMPSQAAKPAPSYKNNTRDKGEAE